MNKNTTMNVEEAKKQLPGDLLREIHRVDREAKEEKKVAAFDLDNTLLIHDIGDAIFAQLKIDELTAPVRVDKKKITLNWEEYYIVLEKHGKLAAYTMMTQALAGIPLETLWDATHRVMTSSKSHLEIEGQRIPVPSPHPVMKALTLYLRSLSYEICIISATNHYTVLKAAEGFFNVPESHVWGLRPALRDDPVHGPSSVLDDQLDGPITVTGGKVDAYRLLAGNTAPMITAGDSPTDSYILSLTAPNGLVIWRGKKNPGLPFSKDSGTITFYEMNE